MSYQGYPYVNPSYTEAPTLTPEVIAERSKYHNLPKKFYKPDGSGKSWTSDAAPTPGSDSSVSMVKVEDQVETEDMPMVFIDIPSAGGSEVSQSITECNAGGSIVSDSRQPDNQSPKQDSDRPIVFIDIPNAAGSSQSTENETEPDFVRETIFYDPFKSRRIDQAGSSRPTNLNTSGTSSGLGSFTTPLFMSKESLVYGQHSPDDFSLSPLPVSDFPLPQSPPSYEEVSRLDSQREAAAMEEPARTTVITPSSNIVVGLPTPERKLMTCPFCHSNVHTLVVEELGIISHIVAVILFIIFMPLVVLVYCCGWCHYKNHYCPACNQKIAYKLPIPFTDLKYVS